MRIFSETQDSAGTRDVLYISVRSEIRLYRQFQNLVLFALSDDFVTRFALVSMGRELDFVSLSWGSEQMCTSVGFNGQLSTTSTKLAIY